MHDWTRVEAGIFHAFHHRWISAISDVLNTGLLPSNYHALPEQQAAGFGPDVLTLQEKSSIAIRHVSGDRIVAMVVIVSPGNKASQHAFLDKACELLEHRIHLLLVDPFPPRRRDPNGIHAAIWEEVEDEPFQPPADKPLTLVACECDLTTRAYMEPVAVGDVLSDMPVYLEPNRYVQVPLEATYQTAYAVMPRRWQRVLEEPAGT
jgi:hypothetical protein